MKLRFGFVSNSSSTGFLITNKSNKPLTLYDFCKENINIFYDYIDNPSYIQDNVIDFLESARKRDSNQENKYFQIGCHEYVFGDEDGDVVGRIFDYQLRNGGESENFIWEYHDSYR